MDIEVVLVTVAVAVIFMSIGIGLFIFGLRCLGVLKKNINKSKWTLTTAIVTGCKHIGERKKYSYTEYAIVYTADGKKYKKYTRDLPTGIYEKIHIYYKNKNPNYFKVKIKSPYNYYNAKPAAAILFTLGFLIFASGCIVISKLIN